MIVRGERKLFGRSWEAIESSDKLSLAPVLSGAIPLPRQAFLHQNSAEAFPVSHHCPQGAAITVISRAGEGERSCIHQLLKPVCCLCAHVCFCGTFGAADFGRVYIGDADFLSLKPEGVSINDAGDAFGTGAYGEMGGKRVGI